MALFTSYAPPGVYTTEIFIPTTAAATGTARIPVIIGEGQQFFTFSNIELFRGSSSVQDDQSVNENISDQITGFTQNFQTTFFPVTDGSGKGVLATSASAVQVQAIYANGNVVPVTVISLNAATGAFTTQEIIPAGTDLTISYFFKRGDTLIQLEDETFQVPAYSALTVTPSGGNHITLSLTTPGATGNLVTLQFVDSGIALNLTLSAAATASGGLTVYTGTITGGGSNAFAGLSFTVSGFTTSANNGVFLCTASSGTTLTLANAAGSSETHAGTAASFTGGVPAAQAVLGGGTDAISINIRNTNGSGRTLADLFTLVNGTSIPTLDGGFLTSGAITGVSSTALVATGAAAFSGGSGPGSNTVFQVQNIPIVDGTNGGVVTTDPAKVTALVNGITAIVTAVNGAEGLVTLANPVPFGQTLQLTYYTNTWQDTYDLLPSALVSSISQVGLGPNRSDFTQGVDYSLGVAVDSQGNTVANTVNWGNNVSEAIGVDAAGDTPFSPSDVLTTLVDENVWLRPTVGAANGRNTTFTLQDTPTDGSGMGRPTDVPTLVTAYVGINPLEAFQAGAVRVAAVNGVAQTVTLFNPPPAGSKVYASYYRNTLEDQQYTLKVVTPGFAGLGTYTAQDNLGRFMPVVTFNPTSSSVAAAGPFAATGIVYPFGFSDAVDDNGSPTENITLTFNNDGSVSVVPAVQATHTFSFTGSTLQFTATQPGAAGNAVQVAIDVSTVNPTPITVSGNLVTVYANWNGTLNTLAQIAASSPTATTADGGQIVIVAGGASPSTQTPTITAATNLSGGTDEVTVPLSLSYTVTSNVATGTGSVTAGGANVGYLDQTYIDPTTGFRITIVRPSDHVAYGVLTIPQSYDFAPADTLVFNVVQNGARVSGNPGVPPAQANNQVALFGLKTKVVSTFGATAGDTVIVSTVRGSGNEPNVGEFYFVTFNTTKQASDYALKMYTNPTLAYANYGQPSTINRLSLGIQLMVQNGVQTFGAIQVPVQPGTNVAAASDYIAALQQLTSNLPGLNRKADVVVPLSTDPTVHQALSRQLTTQATARYKGEAIGFVGYSQFTTAAQASANANSLNNQRMIAIGNAAAGILVTNPTTGVAVEYLVEGPFMAAAMAGLNTNPANDVATTLTLQNLVGFSRLLITYDDATMNNMAANGLTLLLNNNGSLLIRHYKTTNPANTLVSEPTSTTIADYTAQQFRANLQQFIGRKLVDSLVTDITVVSNGLLKNLLDLQIIAGYENLSVLQNKQDPTEVDVTVTFKPIFSLLYLSVTFTVQTSL